MLNLPLHPFGKNKINYDIYEWKQLKTIHFDIHYPGGMEELALKTAEIAENGYVHIANLLRHELTEAVPVIVYPSHAGFQNNNIIPYLPGEGTGGFTDSIKSRVVVPYTGSESEFRHVLVHELVHAFQFNILFSSESSSLFPGFNISKVPLWIAEGMAEYISAGFDETADMVMRDALFNEKYSTLEELAEFKFAGMYLLYKEGQSFFFFLEKNYGKFAVGELFRDIRDLSSIDEAMKSVTGHDLEDMNREWIRFFKKRYFHLAKERNFGDDDGKQITFHEKTGSSINICPALSPDGKKIAYLTNRDIYASLVTASIDSSGIKDKKEKIVKVLASADRGERFEGMHLFKNYLTWTGDGRAVVFTAQSGGRDVIYMVDPDSGKIIREIKPPVRELRDPSVSPDGRFIVFIGTGGWSMQIYLLSLETGRLSLVTGDRSPKRYPRMTPDGRSIIFSSGRVEESGGVSGAYEIERIDIATGKRELVTGGPGSSLQCDISPDGNRILYISNRTGIYNAYVHDMVTGKESMVTNALSGIFYPRWFPDGKNIAFVSYHNAGYDIFMKEIGNIDRKIDLAARDTEYMVHDKTLSPFSIGDSVFRNYDPWLAADAVNFGLAGIVNQGLMGIVQISFSDLLGNHRTVFTANYLRQDGSGDYNLDLAYYYLRYRWDFGFGMYRQKNPFLIYSLEGINQLIHNVNYGITGMDSYGCYGIASYPFTRYFRLDLKVSSGRIEKDYSPLVSNPDVMFNVNRASASMVYDNVLWSGMVPVDGFRGRVEVERAVDISGRDAGYSDINVDMRRYFLLRKKYVFAFRGAGGRTSGEESRYFKYAIGGFNTLRGHPLLEYSGTKMFFVNTEFRFTFIEGIKFGWPLFIGTGNIGGVIFYDAGSAWDGKFNYLNKTTGRYDDLKSDFGFGLRLAIFPIIILKLDYAWPCDNKSIGRREILFSIGFEY